MRIKAISQKWRIKVSSLNAMGKQKGRLWAELFYISVAITDPVGVCAGLATCVNLTAP